MYRRESYEKKARVSYEAYSGSTTEVEESELINIVKNGQKIRSSNDLIR